MAITKLGIFFRLSIPKIIIIAILYLPYFFHRLLYILKNGSIHSWNILLFFDLIVTILLIYIFVCIFTAFCKFIRRIFEKNIYLKQRLKNLFFSICLGVLMVVYILGFLSIGNTFLYKIEQNYPDVNYVQYSIMNGLKFFYLNKYGKKPFYTDCMDNKKFLRYGGKFKTMEECQEWVDKENKSSEYINCDECYKAIPLGE